MPIYETDADKTKEEVIAAIFCKRFKYNCTGTSDGALGFLHH